MSGEHWVLTAFSFCQWHCFLAHRIFVSEYRQEHQIALMFNVVIWITDCHIDTTKDGRARYKSNQVICSWLNGRRTEKRRGRRVYEGHLFEENEELAEGPAHSGTGREGSEEEEEPDRQAPPWGRERELIVFKVFHLALQLSWVLSLWLLFRLSERIL